MQNRLNFLWLSFASTLDSKYFAGLVVGSAPHSPDSYWQVNLCFIISSSTRGARIYILLLLVGCSLAARAFLTSLLRLFSLGSQRFGLIFLLSAPGLRILSVAAAAPSSNGCFGLVGARTGFGSKTIVFTGSGMCDRFCSLSRLKPY